MEPFILRSVIVVFPDHTHLLCYASLLLLFQLYALCLCVLCSVLVCDRVSVLDVFFDEVKSKQG